MKLNSPLRRTATVLAGALIGLTGLTVIAGPASAHSTAISGTTDCDTATGVRTVTWTLTNDWGTDATVDKLTTTPGPIDGLHDGTVIPKAEGYGEERTDGKMEFTQTVGSEDTEATVSFTSLWADWDRTDGDNNGRVTFTGPCVKDEAPCITADQATFTHTFGKSEEGWDATVTLDKDINLCEGEPVTLVSYFAPKPEFSVPQYAFDDDSGAITNEQRSVKLAVDVPNCNTQVDLFFGDKDDIITEITEHGKRYGDTKLGSGSGLGSRSKGPQGWFNGGTKGCQTPAVEPLSQCDGTVVLNLSNNGDIARYDIDFTVKAGEFSKTVTVKPGKGETVEVPAGSGAVTVSAPGMTDVVYNWTPPADCELPTIIIKNDCETVAITVENPEGVTPATAKITYGDKTETVTVAAGKSEKVSFPVGDADYATVEFPGLDVKPIKATLKDLDCGTGGSGGGGDDGPSLPVTGPVAGGIAGGAALLLIAGGVLFFLARRRKITFTA
ncbi:cell wall anchor protein [Actinoplanes sp. NPDC026623]|uniref:cell wall anchor protein n=1 Tax=Actinoplanes sp. NPDC026623 TaxID=3155610 RepID=UPI0033C2E45C